MKIMGDYRTAFSVFVALLFTVSLLAQTPASPSSDTAGNSKSDQTLLSEKLFKVQKALNDEDAASKPVKSEKGYRPSGSKELLLLTLKIMLYLGGLSLILYYGIKFFKKNTLARASRPNSGRNIEVLESAFIGQNRNVSLVKVLDQVLVVGVTDHAISLLTAITDEASVARILAGQRETAPGVAQNFSNTVNAFLAKFKREDRGNSFKNAYRGALRDEDLNGGGQG